MKTHGVLQIPAAWVIIFKPIAALDYSCESLKRFGVLAKYFGLLGRFLLVGRPRRLGLLPLEFRCLLFELSRLVLERGCLVLKQ